MADQLRIYKCELCGNIIEVLHSGDGDLICCEQPMILLEEKTEDQGKEKHVPVIEETDSGLKVKVGSVPHPMEEKHYIEWIEVRCDSGNCRKYLKPGDTPEAAFAQCGSGVIAREYCSIHGLWKS